MMLRAKGPKWHKKYKELGIIPPGLRNLDKEATWSTSKASGWIYGHGAFSLVSHRIPVLGCFMWMRNAANEAKRMWLETAHHRKQLKTIVMDSKADDYALFREFRRQRNMTLITTCRRKTDNHSPERKRMFEIMGTKTNKRYYKERSTTVEPMQGLVKDIFDLGRCWMHGNKNNRWLFAAMGIAVQMAQLNAYKNNQSTWNIKSAVLGVP